MVFDIENPLLLFFSHIFDTETSLLFLFPQMFETANPLLLLFLVLFGTAVPLSLIFPMVSETENPLFPLGSRLAPWVSLAEEVQINNSLIVIDFVEGHGPQFQKNI